MPLDHMCGGEHKTEFAKRYYDHRHGRALRYSPDSYAKSRAVVRAQTRNS